MLMGNGCGTTVLWVVGSHGLFWYGMELLALPVICCFAVDGCDDDGMMLCSE